MIAAPQGARVAMRRVLLVEDHVSSAYSIGRLLTHFGYDVRIERDGLSAIRAAREFLPTIALIDLTLPIVDGFGVAQQVRANPATRSTLLIAMTGWSDAEHEAKALAAGFDKHLVKPLSAAALLDALASRPVRTSVIDPPRTRVSPDASRTDGARE